MDRDYFDAQRYTCRAYPFGLRKIVRKRPSLRRKLDEYIGRTREREEAQESTLR